MIIFEWLNDQLLRMEWLSNLVTWLVTNVFKLDVEGKVGGSIQFFIYDVVKIFILLSILIFVISYIQSFFPPERSRKILGKFTGIWGNLLGALLGTITPFCSCSIGVTFSFLVSSPLVDLASVLLLASIFNWYIALSYVVVGVLLAVVAGTIISKLKLEKYVEPFVLNSKMMEVEQEEMTKHDRIIFARSQVSDIVKRVWLYIVIGVGIGAAIHNWIPEPIIAAVLGQDKWYSVLVATLVGVPMYADIFGTLPIAEALVSKGVGLGTALSFMMAVT
ncbi:MAG: permease, partial [Chloroflexi bacterium]|nr:permease [Chloroflexota bacterium]